MDWWKYASHSVLCNATNELFEEWFRQSNSVSIICGYHDGIVGISEDFLNSPYVTGYLSIAIENKLILKQLQRHCANKQIEDFAWLTLRVSHIITCYNNSDVSSLNIHRGWDEVDVWIKCVITLLFFTVFVVGLIGNFLTVIVIYHTPLLHTQTNYFLASLAVSDFFLIIFGVPYDVIYLWKKSAPPNLPGYCEFMSITVNLFTLLSILTIMALTAERFFALCYPFSMICLGKKRIIQFIRILWIVAPFPSFYIGLQFKQVTADFCGYKHVLNDGTGKCDYVDNVMFPLNFTFEATFTITFALPVSFIIYCYVRILRALSEMGHVSVTQVYFNAVSNGETRGSRNNSSTLKLYLHTKGNELPKSQQAQKVVIKMLGKQTFN